MNPCDEEGAGPLFRWPKTEHWVRLLIALVWLSVLFLVVYGGADYITSRRTTRFPIHFAFELSLPLVPSLSIVYSSVYAMFVFIALAIRTERELREFVWAMSLTTVVAGVCFLLVPAELAFDSPVATGWASGVFNLADQVNLTYNCVPSLHVAYAVLCAETLRKKSFVVGIGFFAWATAIAASAWLTHQHHLIDLITGLMLGLAMGNASRLSQFLSPSGHGDQSRQDQEGQSR